MRNDFGHTCPEDTGKEKGDGLAFIPAKVIMRRDIFRNHRSGYCAKNDIRTQFRKTMEEPARISGGDTTSGAAAHRAHQKFVTGTPRCRLAQEIAPVSLNRQATPDRRIRRSGKYPPPARDVPHGE